MVHGCGVTDGRGSPRDDLYKNYSDDEMRLVRFKEQRKAAYVGEFAAQVMLDIPSKIVKDVSRNEPVEDILAFCRLQNRRLFIPTTSQTSTIRMWCRSQGD
jgi:hypothetical protein